MYFTQIQSVFRIYRYGQKRNTYIYRFITPGTIEEIIYKRQILKQGLSKRIVDNFDMSRPFQNNEVDKLLETNDIDRLLLTKESAAVNIPESDTLLADILQKHSKYVYDCNDNNAVMEVQGINNTDIEDDQDIDCDHVKKRRKTQKNRGKRSRKNTNDYSIVKSKSSASNIWSELGITMKEHLTPKRIVRKTVNKVKITKNI